MNGQAQNALFLFSFGSGIYSGPRHLFKMSSQLSTPTEDFKQKLKKERNSVSKFQGARLITRHLYVFSHSAHNLPWNISVLFSLYWNVPADSRWSYPKTPEQFLTHRWPSVSDCLESQMQPVLFQRGHIC